MAHPRRVQSLDDAQRALAEASRKKGSNARFQAKIPTIGEYAEHWIAGLRLQNSTIEGYRRILRNHVTPYPGAIRLDQLTATRYVFGDDQGAIRVPEAVTSRWTRRLDWACAKIEGLPG